MSFNSASTTVQAWEGEPTGCLLATGKGVCVLIIEMEKPSRSPRKYRCIRKNGGKEQKLFPVSWKQQATQGHCWGAVTRGLLATSSIQYEYGGT